MTGSEGQSLSMDVTVAASAWPGEGVATGCAAQARTVAGRREVRRPLALTPALSRKRERE